MPDLPSDTDDAAQRAAAALEAGIAEVQTAGQAAKVIDQLEATAGAATEAEVAATVPQHNPAAQAGAIEEAVATASVGEKSAAAIVEVATQSTGAPPEEKAVLDEAVSAATGTSAKAPPPEDVRRARRLLRRELFRRLRPLQAIDVTLFVEINHLPHPRVFDALISRFSWVMTGGTGWVFILLAALLRDRRYGSKAMVGVLPALWLATCTVEYPIKRWFRRRRPFIDVVRAVVVGKKPGSYSFPSGHSAAAFAGAALLSRYYPRNRNAFYAIAGMVAFSRVYLGAHYPGDVLSGSVVGAVLARVYARLLRKRGIS